MDNDFHCPTAFTHEEWVKVRDDLYYSFSYDNPGQDATRRKHAHAIGMMMNTIQKAYQTRASEVVINGRKIAEAACYFHLRLSGTIKTREELNKMIKKLEYNMNTKDLDTLRRIGNGENGNIGAHYNSGPRVFANKVQVVDAVYRVAKIISNSL
jgi:hypothetical protein